MRRDVMRLAGVASWLVLGEVAVGGLYWAFINTPDSNALMLAVSAILVIAIVAAAGMALGAAIRTSMRLELSGVLVRAPLLLVALVPAAVIWLSVTSADAWRTAHAGEISAWFIATLGWSDISWLTRALDLVSLWLRGVAAPLAVISLFAALVPPPSAATSAAPWALARGRWLVSAWRWRTLVAATLAFVFLIVMPWQLAWWRPSGLPPTWIEPALAALRLGIIALVMTLGASIFVLRAAPPAAAPLPASEPSSEEDPHS